MWTESFVILWWNVCFYKCLKMHRQLRHEMVYLTLYIVADTPPSIQDDWMLISCGKMRLIMQTNQILTESTDHWKSSVDCPHIGRLASASPGICANTGTIIMMGHLFRKVIILSGFSSISDCWSIAVWILVNRLRRRSTIKRAFFVTADVTTKGLSWWRSP